MLNIKLKNLFWVSIALFCATQFCSAQSSDNLPTAQVPPPHPGVAVPNSESDLTMAGESKSTKAVVEPSAIVEGKRVAPMSFAAGERTRYRLADDGSERSFEVRPSERTAVF